jgi:hypothetical protein
VLPPGRLDDEPLTWLRPLSRYGADDAAWSRLRSRCRRVRARAPEFVVGLGRAGP